MKTKKLVPLYLNGAVYTGDGKSLPKHYRCKSRKRYIKLMMGGGIGRD